MVRPFPVPDAGGQPRRGQCRHAARTDLGQRTKNQDRWLADDGRRIYLVADGMGGRPAGDLVADTVVREIPPRLDRALGSREDIDRPAVIQLAMAELSQLSRQVWEKGQAEPGLARMGAALVLAMIRGQHALVAHLGDCRAYLIRDRQLTRLTRDHTLLQKLLDAGRLTPAQARGHIAATQLTRYVGMDELAIPDAQAVNLESGDRLLLCTDGLCGVVDDARLAEIIIPATDPDATCDALVREAKASGGAAADNVTVILIEVTG